MSETSEGQETGKVPLLKDAIRRHTGDMSDDPETHSPEDYEIRKASIAD